MNWAIGIKGITVTIIFAVVLTLAEGCKTQKKNISERKVIRLVPLPQPEVKSSTSIEEALAGRRSRRDYSEKALQLKEVSQLLWAAQGITGENGKRTAPSAGGIYPIEVYLVSNRVDSLTEGVYHYDPLGHQLEQVAEGETRTELSLATMLQASVARAAAIIVITADYQPTIRKYGDRGIRFVHLEAGHAAQNICLEAVSLNVGVVTVGAFKDSLVKQHLNIPANEAPLYLIPAGKL